MFNDTATTEIYTLSLHDALPICRRRLPLRHRLPRGQRSPGGAAGDAARSARPLRTRGARGGGAGGARPAGPAVRLPRSEEHTSEVQSRQYLVCRLLLEKKKKKTL